jgi:hypothetical protein
MRKRFRKRAGIEPVIGHLKSDHRLNRNYLKGLANDQMNVLQAAAAFNFKKWCRYCIKNDGEQAAAAVHELTISAIEIIHRNSVQI